MSNTNKGGPAFPPSNPGYAQGMTLRDYFAAKAMQTYMISETWNPDTYKNAARLAYRVADAMLKERES